MMKVKIKEIEILIANVDGKFYAIDNKCSNDQADLSTGMHARIVT